VNKVKNIVVLGAGYGGILTAKKLAKKLKKNEEVKITLIDKNSYHTMLTELHEVAAGRVDESSIRVDLKKVFAGRKVSIVLDEILNINFNEKNLVGENGEYSYDYLVLGTGSKPAFYGVKGAKENALTLWSYEDAVKIKYHILDMFNKATMENDPLKRQSLLSFVVAGSGFTGIEMAGELAEWIPILCKNYSVDIEEVSIYCVDAIDRILPYFDEKLRNKATKRLEELGVKILLNSSICDINKDHICINNQKDSVDTHTVIWAAGIQSSTLLENTKEGLEKTRRNLVKTDKYLRSTTNDDVFVVGDNIYYIPEGSENPVPQMVENAEHSSALVAKNIINTLKGEELKEYKPSFHGAMVSIGGRYGVAEVGTKKKMFRFSGFIAMFIKHFINVVYFIQLAGFNKVWSYLMNEIFHVRNRRSFLGGHFSKRSPNFFIFPIRLFLGFMWLIEGIVKLPKIIADPNNIFLIPAKIPVSGATADAVSSASTVVEEVVETATLAADANIFETIVFYAEQFSSWTGALPVPEFIADIVEWSMDLIFYTEAGGFTFMASVFQTAMVVGEILVGLALIAGLFTFLASVVSIAMGLMIWASGMAPVEMLWYIFASFATMGGSGSTLGLDYYVLPWLKTKWKKIPIAKKWYIYTD